MPRRFVVLRWRAVSARRDSSPGLAVDELVRRLATAGERVTGPRHAVLEAITAWGGAFTAEELVAALAPRGVARATVYRTLDLFARLGLLTQMHAEGAHRYTLCEEGHHHHLRCQECGRIIPVDARRVEREIRRLAREQGFRLSEHTLELAGLCAACQEVSGAAPGGALAGSHLATLR